MSSPFHLLSRRDAAARKQSGFSMLELMVVVALVMVLAAFAVPQIQSSLYWYRLNSAVAAVNWSVQSTRYQALMEGYPYQVTYDASKNTYHSPTIRPIAGLSHPSVTPSPFLAIQSS